MKKFYQSLAIVLLLLLSVATFNSGPHSYSKALMILKANGKVIVSKSDDGTVIHYTGPTGRETVASLHKLSKWYSVTVNNENKWKY